jgi:hypothetical protein
MRVALAAALAIVAGVAQAGDGRLEINQSCALVGCFPGDGPGFPVTLGSDASYVLTSSLTLPSETGIGISIGARSTLDFQGFSLIGPIACTGAPPACTPFGALTGISGAENVVIRNGTVRGTTYAIRSGHGTRVEDMTLERNSNDGIRADLGAEGWIVEGCAIQFNGGYGISLNYGDGSKSALIRGNKIRANGGYGIVVAGGGLVLENEITDNVDYGIAGSAFAYGSNHLAGNHGGADNTQVSNGSQIGQNYCGTNTTCP